MANHIAISINGDKQVTFEARNKKFETNPKSEFFKVQNKILYY